MRTATLLFFYLLLCCQTTESLTHKRVILGQNVTLNCDLDVKEIYWLFQKPSGSLVVIFRTFNSESTSAHFYDQTLKNKYSSLTLSRIFISNITTDELGIYYCIKPQTSALQVGNGTRLYISEIENQADQSHQPPQHMLQNTTTSHPDALTHTSISLNVLLFIIIIVLLMLRCRKPRKSPKPRQNVEAEQDRTDDVNTAEYSEIEFPSRGAQPNPFTGTYALLEKPKPDATQTQT